MVAPLFDRDKTYFKGSTRRRWKLKWAPKPGRPRLDADPECAARLARIRETYEATHASERTLERLTGESRRMVRIALGRPM